MSGFYIANLVLTRGAGKGLGTSVPFIVKAPLLEPARILVQIPVNTWQAYNDWGGKSLYGGEGGPAYKVSFERPYAFRPSVLPLLVSEYPAIRYLERRGYDVSYTTNVDADEDPSQALRHRLFISVGHDEYWTHRMRAGFERARGLGTNFAFLGGNDGYWQARYEDHHRTLVEYRSATLDPEPDPALKTVRYRNLVPPWPECRLVGVQTENGINPQGAAPHDFSVVTAALRNPWFFGTGFTAGGVVLKIVGHEWDAVQVGCDVPRPKVLFEYEAPHPADAVRYTAVSGARVFAAGSIDFVWALDNRASRHYRRMPADPRLERFMRNALADLERPARPHAVTARKRGRRTTVVRFRRHPDPRVHRFRVVRFRRVGGRLVEPHVVCERVRTRCLDHAGGLLTRYRYAVYALDLWGRSAPAYSR